jgi:replicative DNA helicase
MPHSIEAEQAVLGSILLSQKIDGTERLHPDDFFRVDHAAIFRAIIILAQQGKPIDLVSVTSKLQDNNELQESGGVSYLAKLANSVPSASNLNYYVSVVQDKHLLRESIMLSNSLTKMAMSADDPRELLSTMQSALNDLIDKSNPSQEFKHAKDIAVKVFENVEHRFANFGDHVTGIPSGFADLDKMTSGWQNSDLIIVAARPSVGKTAFMLNITESASVKSKKNIAVISLEMSAEQLMQRMLSSQGNIDATRLRTGYLEPSDWNNLAMAIGSISNTNLYIDDSPALTVREIAAKCRRLHKTVGLDMILIDYLQLISGRGKAGENRQQEVTDISRTLKQLARELNVPVIALSQLSRGVEQRQDKRPMMSDLRESGAIEQDADIVTFLYRDDYYDKESEKKNIIEIIIGKQRNGPVGTVELAFLKNYNKFASLDRGHQESTVPTTENVGYAVPDMYRH